MVWPDNVRAWLFLAGIRTRWAYGPSGRPLGFRWEAIYPLMDRQLKDDDESWYELRHHLEVMEAAALAAYAEFYPPPKR